MLAAFLVLAGASALAQPNRVGQDAIWVRNAPDADVTIDGVLDEAEWGAAEARAFAYNGDFDLPGDGQKIEGDPVLTDPLDPTVGRFQLFHRDDVLYIGLDTDDQAINGIGAENGRDGFRVTLRSLDSLDATERLLYD